MFPATTKEGGMAFAFPDVCKVPAPPAPPIPTPFPNIATIMEAMPTSCTMQVKIRNMPVLHQMSEIPMTHGDEVGVAGGMISGTFAQKAAFRTSIPKVQVEGNPIVVAFAVTAHNGANANAPAGTQIAPSQAVVIISP